MKCAVLWRVWNELARMSWITALCSDAFLRSLKDNNFAVLFCQMFCLFCLKKIFAGVVLPMSFSCVRGRLSWVFSPWILRRVLDPQIFWAVPGLTLHFFGTSNIQTVIFIKFLSSTWLALEEFDTFCSSIDCIMSQWTSVQPPDPWLSE